MVIKGMGNLFAESRGGNEGKGEVVKRRGARERGQKYREKDQKEK